MFRGDGEIVANPIGTIPRIGGLLARATFEPDLVMTDGEAMFTTADGVVEAWNPYRSMFDVVWSGRRHVIMGGSQLDAHGNHNFAAIGDMKKPKAQLLGFRGAPGNTVNNVTSYWVPNHNPRVFVDRVDVVTGVGYDRAEAAGGAATRFHSLRHVVTNLAVLDFETPERRMRLRSVHPGVTVDDVVSATGFELVVPDDVPESRMPTPDELAQLERIDAAGLFWDDEHSADQQMEAVNAIATQMKFRPRSVIGLAPEKRARYLAQLPNVSDAIAARALVTYHLERRREMMAAFLDLLGVAHENGLITEETIAKPEEEKVKAAAAELATKFPAADVAIYLSTLVSQDPETWAALVDAPQTT